MSSDQLTFLNEVEIVKVTQILNNINKFDFDIFELNQFLGKKSLYYMAITIFEKLNYDHLYKKLNFNNFISKITAGYDRVNAPYHNDLHGGDVLQTVFNIITHGKLKEKLKLEDTDIFSVLVAGICHDFKHPGFNNLYQINFHSKLAIRYNGKYNL